MPPYVIPPTLLTSMQHDSLVVLLHHEIWPDVLTNDRTSQVIFCCLCTIHAPFMQDRRA